VDNGNKKKAEDVKFGFEDLKVWQKAAEFANEVIRLIESLQTNRKHTRLIENLEAAAASPALNIAEGKGRFSKKEFAHFLYIARGSLYETIALLIIFRENNWISEEQLAEVKAGADEIGKMLTSLAKSSKPQ
jgi:four helix bundle protein